MSVLEVVRLGTRRSPLALAQARSVVAAFGALGVVVEIIEIVTAGDRSTAELTEIGGTGVFAAALRHALLAGEVDLAVHSLKDLPVAPEPGLVIAAIPAREDPRDVLVARDGLTLGELPAGSVVGTGSPRRAAQLGALGLGLVVEPVRGNVDTRIGYVDEGRCEGVVLARAGLARLGRLDRVTETLDPIQMLPAPGQGALALECSVGSSALVELLAGLDDPETRVCVTAERELLAAFGAGCSAPVGALGEVVEGERGPELSLRAFVGTLDGAESLRRSVVGPVGDPLAVGRRLAAILIEDGAESMTSGPRSNGGHAIPPRSLPETWEHTT